MAVLAAGIVGSVRQYCQRCSLHWHGPWHRHGLERPAWPEPAQQSRSLATAFDRATLNACALASGRYSSEEFGHKRLVSADCSRIAALEMANGRH
jgi:hypothetical protein